MTTFLKHLFLALIAIMVSLSFTRCSGEKVNFILKSTANEVNKTCPEVLDDFLRLDSCQALPNKILRYNYTITLTEEQDLSDNIENFKLYSFFNSRSIVLENSLSLKFLMDIKTTFQYAYFDTKGKELFVIDISPDEYNKNIDIYSDEYIHTDLNRIVDNLKPIYPIDYEEDNEIYSNIEVLYPKTVVFHIQRTDLTQSSSFDTISHKNKEKEILLETIDDYMFNDLLPLANINYVYKYTDKDGNYLCTLDILPEDYK